MGGRVLVIGLDGYEPSLAEAMMAEGRLPALRSLRDRAAHFHLDHGAAKRTGLAWEHFATGKAPGEGGRDSAVDFDPKRYRVSQAPTRALPWIAWSGARTVVFDAPYLDLDAVPEARGLVAWGAHDPGVPPHCSPPGLAMELRARFGEYPAREWIYGFTWPDTEATRRMGRDLTKAVELRAAASEWLLAERLPDWDLALVVVSECHSAVEPMWHGVDPAHPLHGHPSAVAAGEGLRSVMEATDRLVARLAAAFPDATLVTLAMHGMGPNDSDVASMALLPELMYRHAFGRPHLRPPELPADPTGLPLLAPGDRWEEVMLRAVPYTPAERLWDVARRRLLRRDSGLDWMPAARYRRFWRRMPAFALPSFYDGRIRLNLQGRERHGTVAWERYGSLCATLEAMLMQCRDPLTGEPAVAEVVRSGGNDPAALGPDGCDLIVVWRGAPLALEHRKHGSIGPLPYRRTGGHTGRYGEIMIAAPGVTPGRRGVRSSFDVVPTLSALLGERAPRTVSGRSLMPDLAPVPAAAPERPSPIPA